MKREEFERLKERKIQFFSGLKLRNIFPGEWESVYQGEGIEFADIKPFEPGDDIRNIDLHTLVQSGEEEIIQRVVERQMRVYVWADFSGSMQQFEDMFFPYKPEIRDMAVGLVLFSAVKMYSPIGFYPFGLKKGRFFPPTMGEGYCWKILNWMIDEENTRSFTSSGVERALISLVRYAQPRNIVFFASDFKQRIFEEDFAEFLKPVVNKFDFIPVVIRDPLEKYGAINISTRIAVRSTSERGKEKEIYLTPKILRKIQEVSENHLLHLEGNFRKLNTGLIVLDSPAVDDCCKTFSNFFQARRKIRR